MGPGYSRTYPGQESEKMSRHNPRLEIALKIGSIRVKLRNAIIDCKYPANGSYPPLAAMRVCVDRLLKDLEQIGPANQSLKLAAEFSGITQSVQSSAQLVTQVTVVLNRGTDTDTVAIEAQSVSLSEPDSSLELGDGEE
jgi:hypothetical protein